MPKSLLPVHDFDASTDFDAIDNRSLLHQEEDVPAASMESTMDTETVQRSDPETEEQDPEDGGQESATCSTLAREEIGPDPVSEPVSILPSTTNPEHTSAVVADEDAIVVQEDPVARLNRNHTARKLREGLKRYDLPTNGTKHAMALRLVEAGVTDIDTPEGDESVVLVAE